MRDNVEYEFTTMFEVGMDHNATTSKDRTGLFTDKTFPITEELVFNTNAAQFGTITIVSLGEGDEKLKLDTNGDSRVASIAAGTTVALAGLILKGGVTIGYGGGISNAGNLTLEDCEITGNVAQQLSPIA